MTTTNAVPMPQEDLYRLLKVDPKAAAEQIQAAINKELRLWSQRQNAPQIERRQEAERMVKLLESAESVLLDPARRAEYDRKLRSAPPPLPRAVGDVQVDGDPAVEARKLLADGRIEEARYVAQRATEKDQGNAEAWAVLGYTKARLGKYDDAIYELQRAIQLNPNDPSYYADLAFVFQEIEKYPEALNAYQNAVRLDPSPYYRAGMGWLLVKNGMFQQGLPELEAAVADAPDDPYLHEHLARALVMAATQGWTEIGEGHPILPPDSYPTEYIHVTHAQAMIDRALSLKFDDQELRRNIEAIRHDISSALKRKFTGSWFVAVVTGIIGIPLFFIPTLFAILYVVSGFTPQYKINKRLVLGKVYHEFSFLGSIFNDGNVGCVGLVAMYAIIIVLMPFVVIINFFRNYINK